MNNKFGKACNTIAGFQANPLEERNAVYASCQMFDHGDYSSMPWPVLHR
jgi:hypothetical protein